VSARLGVVDYGMGNRRSVEKALEHVGTQVHVTSDHDVLRAVDGLVVPGVGAFGHAMERLRALGLDDLLRERYAAGVPVLGICLGMQLAFEGSTEGDGAPSGLGLLPGGVRQLEAGGRKLPHIGWTMVEWAPENPLSDGLPDRCAFYHVHSYVPDARTEHVIGTAEYGERFATAVAADGFYGVQFHPEKSSVHGLRLLASFAALCVAGPKRRKAPTPA
jgi:glutamine amidotransferase